MHPDRGARSPGALSCRTGRTAQRTPALTWEIHPSQPITLRRGCTPTGVPLADRVRCVVGRVGRRRGHLLSFGKSTHLSRSRWGGPAPLRGARFIATGRGAQPRRPVDQPTQAVTTPTGCRTGGRESATPWRGRGQDTDLSTGHRRCRGSTCGYEAGIPDGILRLPEMMSFPRSILLPVLEWSVWRDALIAVYLRYERAISNT